MANVLVADDEAGMRRIVDRLLRSKEHTTELVESGEAALETARLRRPDLVLLDVQMPGIGGLEALERFSRDFPGVPVIIMTAAGSIDVVVTAFKKGAVDFVTKPFDDTKLFAAVDAAVSSQPDPDARLGTTMVGKSPRFQEAMDLVHKFARPDINILIQGETGTGKELFARAIHEASKRKKGPFVPVDCSILSESLIESELFGHEKGAFTGATASRIGHFERADGGTLFLDEIGNLPLQTQAKLLRVLQQRTLERVGGRETIKLDIRVISATNVNLKDAVQNGTFRMDLYYRLGEMTIATPPLRERGEDIGPLAEYFVKRYAAQYESRARGLSNEALKQLASYAWPGNVRELENVIKAAVILADERVLPQHLPQGLGAEAVTPPPPSAVPIPSGEGFKIEITFGMSDTLDLKTVANEAAEKAERAVLEALIAQKHPSHAQLAKLVNVDPKTLRGKLRKYGLES